MSRLIYLIPFLMSTPLYGVVNVVEETTPLLDFFTWPMALITLVLCAITAWVLYQKEMAEEKYWIQFYGKMFPYILSIFLIFFVVTVLLAILE